MSRRPPFDLGDIVALGVAILAQNLAFGPTLVALAVLLTSVGATAAITPPQSAGERVLYGAHTKLKTTSGTQAGPKGLEKASKSLPAVAVLATASGRRLLRWRLTPGRRGALDLTLIVNAQFDSGDPTRISGVGVRLRQRRLQWVRVVNGRIKRVLASTKAKIRRRGEVEVVVLIAGGHVDVQAYSSRSERHLGSLSLPRPVAVGRLAIRFGPKHKARSRVTSVKGRPICGAGETYKGKVGPKRFVTVAESHAAKAEAIERLSLLEKITQPTPSRVFRADAVGIERLACAKVPFTVSLETPWKYIDASYRRYRRKSPKKTASGFVVDRAYKNPRNVAQLLKAFARRFPTKTALYRIGRSQERRPIFALAVTADISDLKEKPSFLLNAAHHGNEPLSTEFVFDALRVLLDKPSPRTLRWLRYGVVWLVPQVNPDGAYAFLEHSNRTGRKNGRDLNKNGTRDILDGVDLNRNYPFRWGFHGEKGSKSNPDSVWYRGPSPASEPETKAMMGLFATEHFAASLSYHVGTVAVLAPYTIPGVKNPSPNAPWLIAEGLVKDLPPHPQKRTYNVRKNLYDVDGTDQDWFRAAYGTTALLVEGARHSPTKPTERKAIVAHGQPLWKRLLDRYFDGPTLEVVVRDTSGRPVRARVEFSTVPNLNGERWESRCRDGFFGHMLPGPGRVTVTVTPPSGPPVAQTVKVSKRHRLQFTVMPKDDGARACVTDPGKRLAGPKPATR